jgi:hypothetical protein
MVMMVMMVMVMRKRCRAQHFVGSQHATSSWGGAAWDVGLSAQSSGVKTCLGYNILLTKP